MANRDALKALDQLFADVEDLKAEVGRIVSALTNLGSIGDGRRTRNAPLPVRRTQAKKTRRKKRQLSPEAAALRKTQGAYMGALRGLTSAQKAKVKKVRAKSGYAEALKVAQSLREPKP